MVRKPRGDEEKRKKPRGKEFYIKRGGKKVLANPAPVKTKIKDGTPSIPKKIKDKTQSVETTVIVKEKHQPNQRSAKNKKGRLSHHKERNFLSDSSSVSSTSSSSSEDSHSSHSSGSDDDEKSVPKSSVDSRLQEKATLLHQSSDFSDKDESVTGASTDESTSVNEGTVQVCDWLCEGCEGANPGSRLQLKKCQHPGGQCEKFVHHLCAVNWAVAHDVDEPGNTCREHTIGYQIATDNVEMNKSRKKINKPKLPLRQKNTQSNAGATKQNSS